VLVAYALVGLAIVPIVRSVSPAVEVPPVDTSIARRLGLHRSRGIVGRLAALFALDAFGGGLIVQSLLAFWFHQRFGLPVEVLGAIFFGANLLAAVSALAAARIAARIGLINTMVFTHLPSNVLLMLVPLMPTVELAILVLLARFSISQMDVPTRQSYTMAVVDPDERSAAAGVTGIARTTGAALSPLIAAPLFAVPGLASVPFFLAGALKIVYDLALWRAFSSRRAPDDPERD
jgi:predicted MFS family arabinose efflux permease